MARLENLLGAQCLAVADRLLAASTDATSGASDTDCAALATLLARPGHTVGWLGAVLGLTSSGVTRLVTRLDAAGWVARSVGGDGRQQRLDLTPAGRRKAKRILEARSASLSEALAVLTPAERGQLERLLDKLVAPLAQEWVGALRVCRLCDRTACQDSDHACPLEHTVPDD